MARHLHHWLEMVEAVLIIGILLAIAWLSWQALTRHIPRSSTCSTSSREGRRLSQDPYL